MNRPVFTIATACVIAATPISTATSTRTDNLRAREFGVRVVRVYPHDSRAFTQGLAYRDGFLYEGTGLKGRSTLRKVELQSGKVIQQIDLAPNLFGEGIALLGKEIFQLTWKAGIGFVYDLRDFHLLRQFSYSGEGWGLTTDGESLYMSDGTAQIRVLDPKTCTEKRRITVTDRGKPVTQLNELEWVRGEIFANVWQTDRIARISPRTGEVVGWINLKGILSPIYRLTPDAVLNGIAYDAKGKRLFATGKLWPSVFQIELMPHR